MGGLQEHTGVRPDRAYVDRGYRGHDYPHPHNVFRSGQKRGVHGTIKKELRRRAVVEPIIGHLKSEGHLGRNYLKGRLGDQQNVLLSAAGYNFRLLLKWFKQLFGAWFLWLSGLKTAVSRAKTALRGEQNHWACSQSDVRLA